LGEESLEQSAENERAVTHTLGLGTLAAPVIMGILLGMSPGRQLQGRGEQQQNPAHRPELRWDHDFPAIRSSSINGPNNSSYSGMAFFSATAMKGISASLTTRFAEEDNAWRSYNVENSLPMST
jgi:hypothetical protein